MLAMPVCHSISFTSCLFKDDNLVAFYILNNGCGHGRSFNRWSANPHVSVVIFDENNIFKCNAFIIGCKPVNEDRLIFLYSVLMATDFYNSVHNLNPLYCIF